MQAYVAYFPISLGILIVIDILIVLYVKKALYRAAPRDVFYSSKIQEFGMLFHLAWVFSEKPKPTKYGPGKRPVDLRKLVPKHIFYLCFTHRILGNIILFGGLPGLYLYLRLLEQKA